MLHNHNRATKRGIAAIALSGIALLLAACSTPAEVGPSGAAGTVPDEVLAVVEAGYAGTSGPLPDSAPAPASGQDVWVLSAFQQVSGLALIASEIEAATELLGWSSTVCDGQNNANGAWASCVRQAVAAGADAIVLAGIDCAPVQQALVEAKEAGVVIAGISSFDCDDPTQGGSESLFDTAVQYGDGVDGVAGFFHAVGELRADWVIAQTGGAAKVLHVEFAGVAIGEYFAAGFTESLAKCSGCEIVGTVTITPADIPQLRQKFETGLIQATDANAIVVDLDFMLPAGIQPALVAADLDEDTLVLGGECALETLEFMRAGNGVKACIAISNGRAAWSVVDQVNRAFNGEEPVKDGIGWQILDLDSDLPPAGENYEGTIDYRDGYAAIWGIS